MFVLGGLIALLGVGNGAMAFKLTGEEILKQQSQMAPVPSDQPFQFSPQTIRELVFGGAATEVVVGLSLMLLAPPVRRGSRGANTSAIVIVSLVGVFTLLASIAMLLATVLQPALGLMLCVALAPLILSAFLLHRLIRARGALRPAMLQGAPACAAGWPAPPPGYAPPGYGTPGYGAPGYGAPGYGAPPYGPPGHGPQGYGPWVPPSGYPQAPQAPCPAPLPPSTAAPPAAGAWPGVAGASPPAQGHYGYFQAPAPPVPQPPPGDSPVVPVPLSPVAEAAAGVRQQGSSAQSSSPVVAPPENRDAHSSQE